MEGRETLARSLKLLRVSVGLVFAAMLTALSAHAQIPYHAWDTKVMRDVSDPHVYVIVGGAKVWVRDAEQLCLYYGCWENVIEVDGYDASILAQLPTTPVDGTILYSHTSPEVYVMMNGKRRWIPDPTTFECLGYDWDSLRHLGPKEMEGIERSLDLPSQPGCGDPFGWVDEVTREPGGIRIRGWTIDPDTTAPIEMQVHVGGVYSGIVHVGPFFATAALASDYRPDVGAAYPAYGDAHGFDVVLPATIASSDFLSPEGELCVYAINVGSGSINKVQLGCDTVDSAEPFGFVDVRRPPGGIKVSGWAIDPDTISPIDIHVYVDGIFAGRGVANLPRPDVAAAHPGYGESHGIELLLPPTGTEVCAYAINVGTGRVNSLLGCRTVPVGTVEVLRASGLIRARGWAIDPSAAVSIDVHLYVDGNLAGTTPADVSRPDVGAAYPGYGDSHGFDISIPSDAGSHTVCAYGFNKQTAQSTGLLDCKPYYVHTPTHRTPGLTWSYQIRDRPPASFNGALAPLIEDEYEHLYLTRPPANTPDQLGLYDSYFDPHANRWYSSGVDGPGVNFNNFGCGNTMITPGPFNLAVSRARGDVDVFYQAHHNDRQFQRCYGGLDCECTSYIVDGVYYCLREVTVSTRFHLRHARWSNEKSAWSCSTLDGLGGGDGRTDAGVGFRVAAVDYQGSPHIFYTSADGFLRHARFDGKWHYEVIDRADPRTKVVALTHSGGANMSVFYASSDFSSPEDAISTCTSDSDECPSGKRAYFDGARWMIKRTRMRSWHDIAVVEVTSRLLVFYSNPAKWDGIRLAYETIQGQQIGSIFYPSPRSGLVWISETILPGMKIGYGLTAAGKMDPVTLRPSVQLFYGDSRGQLLHAVFDMAVAGATTILDGDTESDSRQIASGLPSVGTLMPSAYVNGAGQTSLFYLLNVNGSAVIQQAYSDY